MNEQKCIVATESKSGDSDGVVFLLVDRASAHDIVMKAGYINGPWLYIENTDSTYEALLPLCKTL